MKTAFKLAYRNLVGAGLRTWLNVIVLSFSFVVIIWMKGLLAGWDRQAKIDMIRWEIGSGQIWHQSYDPFDPFSLQDAHGRIPDSLATPVQNKVIVPVLISQGTIYPSGRIQSVMIKGIDAKQNLLALPTEKFDTACGAIPAIIGENMARSTKLKAGDYTTLRWRDANGTFDATEICIAAVFKSNVPSVDVGQVWIPLDTLQRMLGMPGEATLFTVKTPELVVSPGPQWKRMPQKALVADLESMIKTKSASQSIFYIILLLLALLAVFDTQVLSIFRRQKEIGTYVALGYTQSQVVWLFTLEGAMHAVLAAVLATIYGLPFFIWQAQTGFKLPVNGGDYGIAIADTLYPVYSAGLVMSTTLLVLLTTALVSYWPSRKIARLKPTEALRGKLQ
ncbi:MAG TPA: FtsX-like permease family protein [Bacteroidales bacterium]|nr:FtsX-like permease family protein [Bacteroidales bacterium]